MTGPSYARIKEVLIAVRRVPRDERSAFLATECEDSGLRLEVESLLAEEDSGFLIPGDTVGLRLMDMVPPDGLAASAPHPRQVGRYRILSVVGSGGMGTVYEAEQDHPRRRVALKMVRTGLASDHALARFKRETEFLGRLQHPGIAQIHEAGTVDLGAGAQPYFAMEFVEGLPLCRFANENQLDTASRLRLVATVCEAVQHAHDRGVVHRDLKPDNILVTDDTSAPAESRPATSARRLGQPKVLDFGIARSTDADTAAATLQTTEGQLVGTLPYMSPEQLEGHGPEIDGRSDVYALGVILFQLLTGRLPIDVKGRPVAEAVRVLRDEEPTRMSSVATQLRGDLDTIVAKALEKDRDRRYASAAELGADLERHLEHQPIVARPASQLYLLGKFARRHRAVVTGAGLAFAALVIGLAVAIRAGMAESRQRQLAETRAAEARLANYRSALVAAQALLDSDPREAFQILERAPEELRHWEWRHLRAQLDPTTDAYPPPLSGDAPATAWDAGWDADGHPSIAVAGLGGLELTDPSTGARRMIDPRVTDAAEVVLSADGRRLAALWDGGERVDTWAVGRDAIAHLASIAVPGAHGHLTLSADGSTLALVSSKERVSAFGVNTGTERFSQPTGRVSGLALWPDGSRCLVASRGHNGFMVVDEYSAEVFSHTGPQVAIGPRGDRLVHQGETGVHLRSTATKETLATLGGEGRETTTMAFNQAGTRLAVADGEAIALWELETFRPLLTLHRRIDSPAPQELVFDAAGERLLERGPGGVRTYDLERTGPRPVPGLGSRNIEAVFHPTLPVVAAYTNTRNEQRVTVATLTEGAALANFTFTGNRLCGLAFTRDGWELIAQSEAGARAWTLPADSLAEPWPPADREVGHDEFWARSRGRSTLILNQRVTHYANQDAGGTLRIVGTSEGYDLFDAISGELVTRAAHPDRSTNSRRVAVVALDPSGNRAATTHADGSIALWGAREGELHATLRGHGSSVYSLAFDSSGERLASGGRDGTLRLWHVESGTELLTLRAGPHAIYSVAFSPDDRQILTTLAVGDPLLWDSAPPSQR